MQKAHPAKLVLGSVQLGLAYGVANRSGMPSHDSAVHIVHRAIEGGVCEIDTARAYGESEKRVGEALRNRKPIRTITKLSPLTDLSASSSREEVRAAVDRSIDESLAALGRNRLECLLLHRAGHLTAFDGAVWERLIELIEDGTVLSLGASIQTPDEAAAVLARVDVQHIQLPFNILDWRWSESGVIERIRARPNVTVHARSALLQGVLASSDPCIWPQFYGVDPNVMIALIQRLVADYGRENAADLCLAYVRGQDWIDGVVVGMETEGQLDANLRLFVRPPLSASECANIAACVPRMPEQLLNPALWPQGV